MPLTLRGEHGEQARETAAFVERLRAATATPGRDVRRAVHVGARRRRRRARRRAPPVRLPGMAASPPVTPPRRVRGPSPEQVRRRRLVALVAIARRGRHRRRRGRRRDPARAPREGAAAAAPCRPSRSASSSPRASPAARWRSASGVVAKIAQRKRGKAVALGQRQYLTATRAVSRALLRAAPAGEGRGFPVPGDLRLPREDDLEAARGSSSWRRSARTGARSISRTRSRRT